MARNGKPYVLKCVWTKERLHDLSPTNDMFQKAVIQGSHIVWLTNFSDCFSVVVFFHFRHFFIVLFFKQFN